MGKNFAIGCSVTVLAVMMLLGGLLYFYIYVPAREYMEGFARLEQVETLNEGIVNRETYGPPANEKMTQDQVDRYVRVQQHIQSELGATFRTLQSKYDDMEASLEERGRQPGFREALDLWKDVVGIIVEAKGAQVQGLNETGLSLSEYHWIRKQTLMALGYGMIGFDLEALAGDPGAIAEEPVSLDPPDFEALEHNRKLLEPHEDNIEEWLAISYFGL